MRLHPIVTRQPFVEEVLSEVTPVGSGIKITDSQKKKFKFRLPEQGEDTNEKTLL